MFYSDQAEMWVGVSEFVEGNYMVPHNGEIYPILKSLSNKIMSETGHEGIEVDPKNVKPCNMDGVGSVMRITDIGSYIYKLKKTR